MHRRGATTLPLLLLASLLNAHAQDYQYCRTDDSVCDKVMPFTGERYECTEDDHYCNDALCCNDPSRGFCEYFGCSAAQVVAAMAARPADHWVQYNGCAALADLGSTAATAVVDAGGIERVTAAMARSTAKKIPDDMGGRFLLGGCCNAVASLAKNGGASAAAAIAAAGGAERVKAAMARISETGWSDALESIDYCERAVSELAAYPCAAVDGGCGAHGACAPATGACACAAGYAGDRCETNIGTVAVIVMPVLVVILCFVLAMAQGARARKTSSLTAALVSDTTVPATAASDASPAADSRSLVVVAAKLASRLSGTAQTAPAPACCRTVESVLAAAELLDFALPLAEAGCANADDIEAMSDAGLREVGVTAVQLRRLRRVLQR